MRRLLDRFLLGNLGLKVISLSAAVVLWGLIATEPEMETSVSVPAEFRNAPQNLELLNEQQEQMVHLQVKGPPGKVRALTRAEVGVVVDLVRVRQPGERTFTLDPTQIRLPRGVSLVKAVPSQLLLKFENRLTREIQVLPRFAGAYMAGYEVGKYDVQPARLKVVGPESRVSLLDYVTTDPIDVSRLIGSASLTAQAYLADPHLRFENLESVRVNVEMRKK
jgi:hypothetical protein